MKRYQQPIIEELELDSPNTVLAGSVTSKKIEVNEVTVEDYKPGFLGDGDFNEINFN